MLLVSIQIYYILCLNLTNHVKNHIIRLPYTSDYGIYYIALCYVGLYCTVLYFNCIVLVLCCVVLCCVVLCCVVLCCVVLCCVALYYITIYYIMAYIYCCMPHLFAGSRRGIGVNEERDQTLNQLLTELDGFEGREGVLLLAATNRAEVSSITDTSPLLHFLAAAQCLQNQKAALMF